MTGIPAAFEPSAFQNDAFQTGGVVPPVTGSVGDGRTMYGGHGESDIEGMKARRRARQREIEIREREREELQAKLDRARETDNQARAKSIGAKLVRVEKDISAARMEAKRINDLIELEGSSDMQRRMLLIIMAAL